MKDRIQYNLLANMFRYPDNDYITNVNECAKLLKEYYPQAFAKLEPFVNGINNKSIVEIEELFGKTFHIQAICYLDLGYVLYAEDYKRGDFLVQMKNEQRKVGNDCGVELADNLPNALTLLPLLEDDEFREELTVRMYIPALETMLKEFDSSRIKLKDKVRKKKEKVILQEGIENINLYQFAIEATLGVLKSDFRTSQHIEEVVEPDVVSSFLPNCDGGCGPTTEQVKTN